MKPQFKRPRPWLAVAALSVGFFMIMMDTSIVTVAIPTMLRSLHASLSQVIWVNSVYLLTFAAPLLLAGRLGDRLGRKPVFLAGMAVFTAASLACGLSQSPGQLIAARAIQGIGAAVMAPQTMAFIATLFPPDKRGAPMGVWGGVGAVASATGPVLGGVLVEDLGWRWIFMVNVPIGVVGLIAAAWLLPAPDPRPSPFDVLGGILSGLGLAAIVFGVQNGQQYHWGTVAAPVTIDEIIGAGVVLLAAFVGWQRVNQANPLFPLELARYRNFATACAAVACLSFALIGMYLVLTIYIQSVLGLSPLAAGLTTLPAPLGAGLVAPFAGRLSDRLSGKFVAMGGLALFAIGIGLIAGLARPHTDPWLLRGLLLICGLGCGCGFSPLANVATSQVPAALMGAASGAYNTVRQIGSVMGSAAIGVLLQARLAAEHAAGFRQSFTPAARETLLLPVAVLLAGLLACLPMTRRASRASATPPSEPARGDRYSTPAR